MKKIPLMRNFYLTKKEMDPKTKRNKMKFD